MMYECPHALSKIYCMYNLYDLFKFQTFQAHIDKPLYYNVGMKSLLAN